MRRRDEDGNKTNMVLVEDHRQVKYRRLSYRARIGMEDSKNNPPVGGRDDQRSERVDLRRTVAV